MEAGKRFSIAIGLIFVLAVTLHTMESTEEVYSLFGDLKRIIVSGVWSSGKNQEFASFSVSPNLSTCHKSYGRLGFLVDCCPPENDLGKSSPIVDFQFPDPSSPLRIRRPVHLLDENYISKYNKAISIMKSLPHSDPRSWYRQANIHCLYCTGAYDQQHSDFPLNIHSTWLFFPWHRMMLYFHERILGSLIGDETFALPFWAWDIPEGMMLPGMFLNSSFVDKERDISHFPPRIVDLNFIESESGLNPEEQVEQNLALMYNQMVSGAKKMELFMGCPYKAGEKGYCHGIGTIEFAPHDTMHTWVGSSLNPKRENMGVFYSAARDPIFYPHHTNIDRLWEVWRKILKNKDVSDPDWLNSYFYFHDEKMQLVRIKIQDVLDMSKLWYSYEDVGTPWLNACPKPSVPPAAARLTLKEREAENVLQIPGNPFDRALDTNLTAKVTRPKINRSRKEKEEEEEVLVLYGIDVREDMFVKFDVYINVVAETIISPRSREFAGTFVHIPKGVKPVRKSTEVMGKKQSLKLGISELLEDLKAEGDENIWVTLFPRSSSCINTTVDGMRIDYLG